MEIILTHENTDFDALASLLGAAKLYPEALPTLPHRLNRNLRDFLTFYWDELPFVQSEDLPRQPVERVILVDTQTFVPPKGIPVQDEMHIIDHHPLSRELETNMTYHGGGTGATTTILVERISEAGLPLSPIEATLLLLGIYEDTGSLVYPTTTPRDLRCAAWLLEQGANLDVVSDFLHYPLTDEQQELYNRLIENIQTHEFAGQSVIISAVSAEGYVEEISTLAHKLRDLYDPAALFLLVDLGDHIQLVARSTSRAIDVAEIAACFQGGGHSRAAAALIRSSNLVDTQARLIELLRILIKPTVTVRQIMSFGVHTLSPDTTVAEAGEMMRRYGHEGFPVVKEGRIVGILTRREIDKALHHRLGGARIEIYMHKGEVSVSPNDSVERLQGVMREHGLGQVPVVENDQVIGIVTRTDLIKLWSTPPQRPRTAEIAQLIEGALPSPLLDLIHQISQTASEMGYSIYFVGGLVRDLLLGIPNFDIDLVVEGDAIALANRLARRMGGRVRSHARFGTAKWLIADGLSPMATSDVSEASDMPSSIDFVTARTEFYKHPTALPEVERSSIKQDLHRRDFTINTLAIRLDPGHYGELLNFYGGEHDLKEGLIRVLHSLSFVEDPTRILRAVRLEQRLGFKIEERTEELIGNALELLDRISGERIRHELHLIFQEERPEKSLCRLEALGVLAQIHSGLRCDDWLEDKFQRLRTSAAQWEGIGQPASALSNEWSESSAPDTLPRGDRALAYLALLTYRMSPEELEILVTRLTIACNDADLLREVGALRSLASELAREKLPPSAIYRLLNPYSSQAIFILWVASDSEVVRRRLELYHRQLRHVKSQIDGDHLKEMGIPPGPIYGQILGALRDARLDGEISTLEEEKALVEALLAEAG